jgi:hypothetical protein
MRCLETSCAQDMFGPHNDIDWLVLVKQMVVAFIVIGTCSKPQHRLSNFGGHKKDEELRDTDRDREITMVPGIQQTSQKFSWFVFQQQKLQQQLAKDLKQICQS